MLCSVRIADEGLYFNWIFSSLLFRCSILACATGLILSRRVAAGIFLYLFSAALLLRFDNGFYANGFSLVAVFVAFYIFAELQRPAAIVEKVSNGTSKHKPVWQAVRGAWISFFPINPIVNFVTGIPPASKYVFMYPWVAEIGQQELIQELKANPAAVVWINTNRNADSPEGVATYMADTINFLNKDYVLVSQDLWMSPELSKSCSASRRGGGS